MHLNSLGANIAVHSGGGGILRPGRGTNVLIPPEILDCPGKEKPHVVCNAMCRSVSLPQYTARLIRLFVSPIHRRIRAPSKSGPRQGTMEDACLTFVGQARIPSPSPSVGDKCAADAFCFEDRIESNLRPVSDESL